MGRAAYEAYQRDEAEQRRLLKKLKGRKGQEDDGMGFFFDSLPGMEILARGDELEKKRQLANASKKAADSFGDKLAKLRKRDAMDSDEDEEDDGTIDDAEDEGEEEAPGGSRKGGEDGGKGVVDFDELDAALEAAFADDDSDNDDDDDDDGEEYEEGDSEDDEDPFGMGPDDDEDDSEGEEEIDDDDDDDDEEEEEEDEEPRAAPAAAPAGKYIPPAQRAAMAAAAAKSAGKSADEIKAQQAVDDAARQVGLLLSFRTGNYRVTSCFFVNRFEA
jgi:hypothetical protein